MPRFRAKLLICTRPSGPVLSAMVPFASLAGTTHAEVNMARKTRQVRSREFWVRAVGKFGASGLSQRKFAQAQGLDQSSLARWVRKLRDEEQAAPTEAGGFIEVAAAAAPVDVVPAALPVEVRRACRQVDVTRCAAQLRLGAVSVEFAELPPASYLGALLREAVGC